MLKFSRKNRLSAVADIDVTTFMNLMVILVPFLLVTAVFSRMTVLQLQLPAKDSPEAEPAAVQLQIAISPQQWILRSNATAVIAQIAPPQTPSQWRQFSEALIEIKRQFPEEKAITLLFSRQVPYQQVLAVMDHVRQTQVVVGTEVTPVELFPDIALGSENPPAEVAP
jgi:biopolymer transport protein ExbD